MVNAVAAQSERRARHRPRSIWQCTWFNVKWVHRREHRMCSFRFNLRWIVLIALNSKSIPLFACLPGLVQLSSAQLIPHVTKQLCISMDMNLTVIHMRSIWPHYMSWCIPSIYSMSSRPHFVYWILSMRYHGIYAAFWRRNEDIIKRNVKHCEKYQKFK